MTQAANLATVGSTATAIGGTTAQAWVRFAGATSSIYGSFNVSSITRNGTGDYSINFTTAMPNVNYSSLGTAGDNGPGVASSTPTYVRPCAYTTTYVRVGVGYSSGSTQALFDYNSISVAIFSS
jgi:hypothetical protein